MPMILQLLVATVAVGLGVDAKLESPPYKEYVQAMEEASETLEKNMLSMQGNIPLLNDSRRHYAEIVYVINYMGITESGCARRDYNEIYQSKLNISAPLAINDPAKVIDEIRELHDDVSNKIRELKQLIDTCVYVSKVCNILIDTTVKANLDKYRLPDALLRAAGQAALELNKFNGKFEEVSKDLKAHQYVITSPGELEHIVWAVAAVHQNARNIDKVDTALKC